MTYKLILGDRIHSSWSLRGWLVARLAGINPDTEFLKFEDGPVSEQITRFFPAVTVPLLIPPENVPIGDSLAITEELASRFPNSDLFPVDPESRAIARVLITEMHSGFTALRNECPMDLVRAYKNVPVSGPLQKDLDRLQALWAWARKSNESDTPWLCGEYCAADAFFAPVAARIAGYGLPVDDDARAYVEAHLGEQAFRQWRSAGLATDTPLKRYEQPHERSDWPRSRVVKSLPFARKTALGTPENDTCPYSGKPATWLMEFNGRVFGMCNRVCRDKTVADPGAWPEFLDLYHS